MKNYRITVQYDGTRYNGWQRQGNTSNTIEEKFENVLSIMCKKKVHTFAWQRFMLWVFGRIFQNASEGRHL